MTAQPSLDTDSLAQVETAQLVARLLGGPLPRRERIARRLLEQAGGIERVRQLIDNDLLSCGASRMDVVRLLCALEVGRRALVPPGRPTTIREPRDAWRCVAPQLVGVRRERFIALLLDVRNRPIRTVRSLEGGVDSCPVDPREVFRPAVVVRASGIIVAHNHPSGDPIPSPEDIALTDRLDRAGAALGIPLLDHLIVVDDPARPFISLAERGALGGKSGLDTRQVGEVARPSCGYPRLS